MVGKDKRSLSSKKRAYLKRIYFTPKEGASFTSPSALLSEVKRRGKYKFSIHQIQDYISEFESYTLARQRRQKFKKIPFVLKYLYQMVQIDLVDMSKFSKENDNMKYWLTLIDCFSRKAYIHPIKDKKTETVTNAFLNIVKNIPYKIYSTHSDLGSEFTSKLFRKTLKDLEIEQIFAFSHSSIIERFHRTIKSKINRYFIYKNTFKYIDILDLLLNSYNNTHHRAINLRPNDITRKNQFEVYQYIISKHPKPSIKAYKLKLNEAVRISFERRVFDREMGERFSRETFKIRKRYRHYNINLYMIDDCNSDIIIGSWYENELQSVREKVENLYEIESILKQRGNMALVKWRYYPEKCATNIPISQIKNVKLNKINNK
jgi:transposase InsO family protein